MAADQPPPANTVPGSHSAPTQPAPKKPLSPAAERALAEAAQRRAAREASVGKPSPEVGGRGGLDPVRYGDWELDGRAADF